MPKPVLLFLVVAAAAIAAVVLWPTAPVDPPTHYVAVIDWSDSMPADLRFFVDAVNDGILRRLDYGDTVDILVAGATSQTERKHVEIPRKGGSMVLDSEASLALADASGDVEEYLRKTLSGKRAAATALIETLAKIPVEPALHVLVVSDGKQATAATVNLEREKIDQTSLPRLAKRAVSAIAVPPGFLATAQLQFRLPTLSPDASDKSVNSVEALERFWLTYLAEVAPGARLISFDSQVVHWQVLPQAGGAK